MYLREERRDGQKNGNDVNNTKLKGLVRNIDSTNRSIILRSKNTDAWLNIQDTMVTGTALAATEFRGFIPRLWCHKPPTFRENSMAVAHPLMYATHLSAAKEAL